eukprot:TRINITY_DN74881_c0_g1_i1.p1 TRINITY_DN74881_c0_g1~~TRINITY_DN74881_c0_g1_i1.p1  ORF type:complete len:386 (-),score=82.19 TRINITY_DN74881_c0_g1_i1:146-1303(-)
MAPSLLRPPTARGVSCTRTLLAALEDTELRPEIVHVVGASEAELSLDYEALAAVLPRGASVVLIGPHVGTDASEDLIGPEEMHGLRVYVFPQTYQRYMVSCHDTPPPQFVALFHPGLDIHYFSWYACLKFWVDNRIPVMLTAYSRPEGLGETPQIVGSLLEALVGKGGGAGLWVIEEENPHSAEDGSFNAGYFVVLGSQGTLPIAAEEMYFSLYQALMKLGHPFAPRVGYLDVEGETAPERGGPSLAAAIAEGAVRAAASGDDGCDAETSKAFAMTVLDAVLGKGSGEAWARSGVERQTCPNCGDGFDHARWHRAICPAVGLTDLSVGDNVQLARLQKQEYNGRQGVLQRFDRQKHRWVVRMDGRDALFKPVNLDLVPDRAEAGV